MRIFFTTHSIVISIVPRSIARGAQNHTYVQAPKSKQPLPLPLRVIQAVTSPHLSFCTPLAMLLIVTTKENLKLHICLLTDLSQSQ